MADTGNNRKIVNFTYNSLYARPIKVVSVDNLIRNNHFYYFSQFIMLQQKNDINLYILAINCQCLGQIS